MNAASLHLINLAYLVTVLLGLPSAASLHLGQLRLSSSPLTANLVFCGLVLGSAGNLLARRFLKNRACRRVLGSWCVVFLVLAAAQWLILSQVIHFRWLKDFLLWLRGWIQ